MQMTDDQQNNLILRISEIDKANHTEEANLALTVKGLKQPQPDKKPNKVKIMVYDEVANE
jgi:hypothetical protein